MYTPGSIFLYHGDDAVGRLIQRATHSPWNHCGVIVAPDGATIEAEREGVGLRSVTRFPASRVKIIALTILPELLPNGMDYLRRQVGKRYGFLTIVSQTLQLLTGTRIYFAVEDEPTCAVLVARYAARVGHPLSLNDDEVRPADIDRELGG